MSDPRAISAAALRVEADPTIIGRLAGEVRRIAREVRSRHPAGHVTIDGELAMGLATASHCAPGSGEQLLEVERLHRAFLAREVEAKAEDVRRADADMKASIANRAALLAGGSGAPPRDPDILEAARVLRMRVEGLTYNLSSATVGEVEFSAMLDDMAAAAKSFNSSVGLAVRASRMRRSVEIAREAAASIVAEAA